MVGVATFAEQFPSFVFSIHGGIMADRYNRFRILMLTQILSAVQAVLLTAFAFAGVFDIRLILGLSVFLGVVNAYDVPVRQSMINEIVDDPEDLPNAIAMNASLNTFARLVGPAFAGLVLAKFSASFCFLLNALSFIAVIWGIAAMRFPAGTFAPGQAEHKGSLGEAIDYLRAHPSIAVIIILTALNNFLVLPYATLLPVYAKAVFRGGASLYGWLNAAIGLGAFIGASHLAALRKTGNLRALILFNTLLLGVALLGFAYCGHLIVALLILVIIGYSAICQTSMGMTIVQTETDKAFRGRVVSLVAMAIFGMLPVGSLMVGKTAPLVGTTHTFFAEGCLSLALAGLFFKILVKHQKKKKYEYTKNGAADYGSANSHAEQVTGRRQQSGI